MNILLSKIKIEPETKKEHFDIFEFRKTIVFKSIEQAKIFADGLELKQEGSRKILNLDKNSGSEACASFLSCIERLLTNAFN